MINIAMLHSVGSNKTKWCDRWLSIDKTHFELLCRYLSEHHYQTGFLDTWYDLEDHPEKKNGKEFFLTFDDGYLDNLLIAYQILKKYGLKATIFINPEFVDRSEGIRTLESRNGNTLGFLNWDEIRFLDKSGVFDVQSHSMSHNFYFASNKLVDIYEGQNTYHWMPWIANNDEKMYWQDTDQSSFVPFGTPVFEKGRALGLRRYFPDEQIVQLGISLYQQKQPKSVILERLNEAMESMPGRFETDEEMRTRYVYELFESKRILESKLNKTIDFLCWPGGGYNELSLQLAQEAGYKASTIASKENVKSVDNAGKAYKRMVRRGLSSCVNINRVQVPVPYTRYLIYSFKTKFRNDFTSRVICKLISIILKKKNRH